MVEKESVPEPLVVRAWPLDPSLTLRAGIPTELSAISSLGIFVFAIYALSSVSSLVSSCSIFVNASCNALVKSGTSLLWSMP